MIKDLKNLNEMSKTELRNWEKMAKKEINEWWKFLIKIRKQYDTRRKIDTMA